MRSVRVYLIVLVAICLLLATSAFALVVDRANAYNRRQSDAQLVETAKALSQAVDLELERALGILSALRNSQAASERDWAALDRQARATLESPDEWIVVHDRQGRHVVNTGLPAGSPLPTLAPLANGWHELANGRPRVCDLVRGAVERQVTCVDMLIGPPSSAEYAISMMIRPRAFDPIVRRDGVGDGQLASLVDRSSRVIWRNIRPEQFIGHIASGKLRKALSAEPSSGVLESVSLDGVPMLSAYHRSPLSGWSVIVGAPLDQIGSATRKAFWSGSLFALGVAVFSVLLATLLGSRLARAVNVLGSALRLASEGHPVPRTGIDEFDAAAASLEEASKARRRSEERQDMLVGELNHRVKNTLAVVQSLAHQSFRNPTTPEHAINAFEARLQALAATHNLLTQEGWKSAAMSDVVQLALAPFCSPLRCVVGGPPITLTPQAAVSLALAFHELATNASKYGALANDTGVIHVSWGLTGEVFQLEWREEGGPLVEPPSRVGFGSRLIKRSLAAELGGTIDMDFCPQGLVCRVSGRAPAPASGFSLQTAEAA